MAILNQKECDIIQKVTALLSRHGYPMESLNLLNLLEGNPQPELKMQTIYCVAICRESEKVTLHWYTTSSARASEEGGSMKGGEVYFEMQVPEGISPSYITKLVEEHVVKGLHLPQTQRGLNMNKFQVTRTDGSSEPGGKHHGCEYFVLDLTHDPYSVPAMVIYALACGNEYGQLKNNIFDRYKGLPPMRPSTRDWLADLLEPYQRHQQASRDYQTFLSNYNLKPKE